MPSVYDRRVAADVAKDVDRAAILTGVARRGSRGSSATIGIDAASH